jgi:uncharacterized protein (TIGR03546 family)
MVNAIVKLLKALNGNIKKSQIAAGIAWGVLLALVPVGNFYWVALFLISLFFNHNHGSKIFSMAVLKLFAPLFAPALDALGWEVLHFGALQPLFTSMYNMPFVPFTKFNNTLVAGGIVGGAILWLPMFGLFMFLVPVYRNTIAPKLRNLKIVKAVGKIPLLKFIEKAFAKN